MARSPATGAPPQGDLRQTEQLAHPPSALRQTLGRLTALTTARLRFGNPPLGDRSPIGAGPLVIAAAIGSANIPKLAIHLLGAVPESATPVEWVARHGIVEPALRFLPEQIADECRAASPLTSLLDRPLDSQEAQVIGLAQKLLAHPAERLSLALHLARPVSDMKARVWRQTLLDVLRVGGDQERSFVLDVYEALRMHHWPKALEQLKAARAVIVDPVAASNDERLRDAVSVANFWGPLWRLERTDAQALRNRIYLEYEYREGLKLFRLYEKLIRGSSAGGIL